jgi:LmbE family N-acetylglucosaminyl deacetylase
MKISQFLEETRQLPVATRSEIVGDAPFVVLSPHPDDESLGLGGLIKQARNVGQRAIIVVLTDGAGSHTKSRDYPAARLIALRKHEVLNAASLLGLDARDLHHFDQPDAGAPSSGSSFERAVGDLATIIRSSGSRNLFVTWRHDPHCDHAAAAALGKATIALCPDVRLWEYPIWGWHLDPETEISSNGASGYRIDITSEIEIKAQAIAAHQSQMTDLIADDAEGFRFTPRTLAPFLGNYEYIYSD